LKNAGRREFLRTAPVAMAAGLALADATVMSPRAEGQSAAATFQVFTAQTIADDIKGLAAKPGNNNLADIKTATVVLTTEVTKAAKEFEWHEGRDHILQIVDGTTVYEVGGTPKDGRNIRPGEWLAPASEGATTMTLKKGDLLVIPRGTPHKRTTADSVTLILISPMGKV